jgi:hypothetical protein
MSEKSWKRSERRVARLFGAERNPLSGGNSGVTRSDSRHERLFIETKERARHEAWSIYDDAAEKAKKEGKLPVVALVQRGRRGVLICVNSADLKEFAAIVLGGGDGDGDFSI